MPVVRQDPMLDLVDITKAFRGTYTRRLEFIRVTRRDSQIVTERRQDTYLLVC